MREPGSVPEGTNQVQKRCTAFVRADNISLTEHHMTP
jgi:hypothetical protein